MSTTNIAYTIENDGLSFTVCGVSEDPAGLGARFFLATKASPKEMLPVVDKPLI